MNLQNSIENKAGAIQFAAATTDVPRDICVPESFLLTRMISKSIRVISLLATCVAILAPVFIVSAQTNYYSRNGSEYGVIGSLFGDQVFPSAAISAAGGFVVWQDNATDGDGWGISARRLDSTLSGTLGTFRVNANGAGNQENPQVALLKNGGAVFVWQGGLPGNQHIYARFLTPTNTFVTTNDILVNSFTNNFQANPAVAVLNNSNVVVVWGSYNEAGSSSLQDVYGQILSPAGQKIGSEFLVNQFTSYNQRTPSVAALAGGGFVVAWISEQERQVAASNGTNTSSYVSLSSAVAMNPSVDVYARLFSALGTATGGEFLVNTDLNPCANPVIGSASDGGFLVAWTARDMANSDNSLDIRARTFDSSGSGGLVFYVNSHLYGDQYVPRVSSIGLDYLVAWTSLAQDGFREGVYGQFVHNNGALIGNEFLVNTTTIGQQMQPTVASDGVSQFLVVWTSFSGYPNTFDLYAQRYMNVQAVLPPLSAPFVWAPFTVSNNVYQPQLAVSWAPVQGLSVSSYEIYVDGAPTNMAVTTSNVWTMTGANGLSTNSTHSFKVDYVVYLGTNLLRAALSPSASGATWLGLNWGGIPYEWMATYFGGYYSGVYHTNFWPPASTLAAAGGPSLYQVFLSGGDPYNSSTWLTTSLVQTSQGLFLSWNTQPGAMYQIQSSTNFGTWTNLGSPRFAAGTTDSIYVGGSPVGYYRVILMR